MADDFFLQAAMGVVGAGAGLLGKVVYDLLSRADEIVHTKRIEAYTELWKTTEILPLWPPSDTVSYEKLREFSASLRDWYFRGGGMFLSRKSQAAYAQLQKDLTAVKDSDPHGHVAPDSDDYQRLRSLCSTLRTRLTEDLSSRRRPLWSPSTTE